MTAPRTGPTLYDRVFDEHVVDERPDGTYRVYVGLHYVNEVTSGEAFRSLARRGIGVARPDRTVAVVDHVVPEAGPSIPVGDADGALLVRELEANASAHEIRLLALDTDEQGIVHVVGPEAGITQPGMVVCCGDSHTSTHGALGALAFGIGTSQVRDVLATQSLLTRRLAVRQVVLDGSLPAGVESKDVVLHLIRELGVDGGLGYAYEYAGSSVRTMAIEERMTLCNMSVEGGAQVGYVCPDEVTEEYLAERVHMTPAAWSEATEWWASLRSGPDAVYADVVTLDVSSMAPMVTWGVNPGQSVAVDEPVPRPDSLPAGQVRAAGEALEHMRLDPGAPLIGVPIDVAFIGSCANSRIGDIARVVDVVSNHGGRVAPGVRAVLAPGSTRVLEHARRRGWVEVLESAGFTVANPGCSLCVGINGAPLEGSQLCASTSTRNFKGRQGAPGGRTILMSPAMVAAAALAGKVVDVRDGWVP